MVASVDTMLEKWKFEQAKEIQIDKEFKLLTSEVISRTAFGSSYIEGKNIFEMLTKLGILAAKNAFKIRLFGLKYDHFFLTIISNMFLVATNTICCSF